MRMAMSATDIYLIHLAVGWFNGHREKGAEQISPPRIYESAEPEVTVTDEDREHAARMLERMSAIG